MYSPVTSAVRGLLVSSGGPLRSSAPAFPRGLFVSALQQKDPHEPKKTKPAPVPDAVIHTGQQWDPEDIRNVRFLERSKEVNTKWAVDLIKKVPPKEVERRVASCDGGGGALGHPRVYINLDSEEPVACIYCGLRFVHKHHHHH